MAAIRAAGEGSGDVIDAAGAAAGDHRHRHRIGHGAGELQLVARLGAIAVHRGEQDLARPQIHHLAGPCHRIEAGVLAAALHIHIPARFGAGPAAGIDRHHDALAAEALGTPGHQLWIPHGRGVEAHLVGTGAQQLGDALHAADAAAHRERDRHRLGGAAHQIHQRGAALVGGGDIEEHQLIGA